MHPKPGISVSYGLLHVRGITKLLDGFSRAIDEWPLEAIHQYPPKPVPWFVGFRVLNRFR